MKKIQISFSQTLTIIFIVMAGSLFTVTSTAQHRQRQQFHAYKKQNKRYTKACKILAKRRYREYMQLLAAMNQRRKPRAEVDTPDWSAARIYRSRQVKYTAATFAALFKK